MRTFPDHTPPVQRPRLRGGVHRGKNACVCARVTCAHARAFLIRARARLTRARRSLHCSHPTRVLPLSRCSRSGLQRRQADACCCNAAVAPGSKASSRVGDNTHGRALDGRSRRRSFRRPPRRPSLPDLHGSRPPQPSPEHREAGGRRRAVAGACWRPWKPWRMRRERRRGASSRDAVDERPRGAGERPPPRSVEQRALPFLPPRTRGSKAAARRALLRSPRRRAEGREGLLPCRRAGSYVARTRGAHVRFRPAPTCVRVTSWPH